MKTSTTTLRILLVEDDPDWLQGLEDLYREIFAPCEILTAMNPKVALSCLEAQRGIPFHLISLDFNLSKGARGNSGEGQTALPVLRRAAELKLAGAIVLITGVAYDTSLSVVIPDATERRRIRTTLASYTRELFGHERVFYIPKNYETPSFDAAEPGLREAFRQDRIVMRVKELARSLAPSYTLHFDEKGKHVIPPELRIRFGGGRVVPVHHRPTRSILYSLVSMRSLREEVMCEEEFLRLWTTAEEDSARTRRCKAAQTAFNSGLKRQLRQLGIPDDTLVVRVRKRGTSTGGYRLINATWDGLGTVSGGVPLDVADRQREDVPARLRRRRPRH